MNLLRSLLVIVLLIIFHSCKLNQAKNELRKMNIVFKETTDDFTKYEQQLIVNIITNSEKEIRTLLPSLPEGIKVIVEIVDWDLNVVGGVTGRAESNAPPLLMIQISNKFPGGIVSAVNAGLRSTVYHEMHHLSLGWAIKDNKLTPEIPIAAIIEGLAEVFAEENTKVVFEENQIPEGINADEWIKEILALPEDANYQTWMFQHPDGRTSIGYKTGNYLVKQALLNSGKTIVELSSMSPNDLLKLAGY